jgi:hypothetical protein
LDTDATDSFVGANTAFSADGIVWKIAQTIPWKAPFRNDDHNNVFWDADKQQYVVTTRMPTKRRATRGGTVLNANVILQCRSLSKERGLRLTQMPPQPWFTKVCCNTSCTAS